MVSQTLFANQEITEGSSLEAEINKLFSNQDRTELIIKDKDLP